MTGIGQRARCLSGRSVLIAAVLLCLQLQLIPFLRTDISSSRAVESSAARSLIAISAMWQPLEMSELSGIFPFFRDV